MASPPPSSSSSPSPAQPNAELLRQIQMGLNAFWLMHRFTEDQLGNSSSGIFPTFPPQLWPNFSQLMAPKREEGEENQMEDKPEEEEEPPRLSPEADKEDEERKKLEEEELEEKQKRKKEEAKEQRKEEERKKKEEEEDEKKALEKAEEGKSAIAPVRPSVLDKRWEFVSVVESFAEFEHLRCLHQVSRNRTFAYGIRYSCTQKTQMRSNCPYLLVCIFAEGAGENSPPGVGKITVYSRNSHTHPVKAIKRRLPRSVARQAKREREEQERKRRRAQEEGVDVGEEEETGEGDEEEGAEEMQVLEVPKLSTSSAGPSPVPAMEKKLEEEEVEGESPGNNELEKSNLMELLAELSQHFASAAAKQGGQ